ncbi:unnamed protein product [Pleuronectes platessa]|uniref:Uncharacterized protein n=1 Tax=Pleuronectes platessa TaxID=8262 RepID=A0A9N7VM19_PLEPL|nr:unnamed protein product [Pleuronectes platessa]
MLKEVQRRRKRLMFGKEGAGGDDASGGNKGADIGEEQQVEDDEKGEKVEQNVELGKMEQEEKGVVKLRVEQQEYNLMLGEVHWLEEKQQELKEKEQQRGVFREEQKKHR